MALTRPKSEFSCANPIQSESPQIPVSTPLSSVTAPIFSNNINHNSNSIANHITHNNNNNNIHHHNNNNNNNNIITNNISTHRKNILQNDRINIKPNCLNLALMGSRDNLNSSHNINCSTATTTPAQAVNLKLNKAISAATSPLLENCKGGGGSSGIGGGGSVAGIHERSLNSPHDFRKDFEHSGMENGK